ncbi:MAG: hypothetical protein ACR2GU_09255 [Rubrobacteraceae bacterium]
MATTRARITVEELLTLPNDTAADVQSKVQVWLETGVRLVRTAYPSTRSVVVHKSLKGAYAIITADTLDGDSVAPGFECPVADVFK